MFTTTEGGKADHPYNSMREIRLGSLLSLLTSLSLAACMATGGTDDTGSGGSSGSGTGGAGTGTGGVGTGGSISGTGGSGTGGGTVRGTGGSGMGGGTVRGTGGSGMGGGPSPDAGGSGTGGGASPGTGGSGTGGGSPADAGATTVYPENSGANCNVTAGAQKNNTKLPNPFAMHDGTVITTKAQWECRRNEIKKDLEKYEVGIKQEPPMVTATLAGTTLSVVVKTSAASITLTSPVSGSGSCVIIGMNGPAGIVSGCTQVPFMHDQVVFEDQNASRKQSDPFSKAYPDQWNKIGNYSAWAWGISRLIDGIEQVKDQLKVDTTKIGTWGCSYAGKMSLFAGALDERVALTIVEESGGGGINSWRLSQAFTTRTGTNVEKIDNTNYSWFLPSMKNLDPNSLPHDHHELIAMIAPRATIILGNDDYEWLGDESGYKSTIAAIEVWKALGVRDHIGYDFTSGHAHCMAPATQVASVKTFVDRFLKGGTGSPNVAIKPPSTKFNLDTTSVIDWTTPTLQ